MDREPVPHHLTPSKSNFDRAMSLFSEGRDRYGEDLKTFSLRAEDSFEKGLLDLSEAYKTRIVRGREVDNILGVEPLPEELDAEGLASFEEMGIIAGIYRKNGLTEAAKTISDGMFQTIRGMDERQAERLAGKPGIDKCMALTLIEKMFKLQAALGRFVRSEDKGLGLARLNSLLEDEIKRAVETGDTSKERYLWGVVLSLEKTDPDKLADFINNVTGLVEEYLSSEPGNEPDIQ